VKPLDLAEEEIDTANVDELRVAYRELLAETRTLRTLISERTCAAVDNLRERGLKFNGNLPYGLESDDKTKKLKPSRYEKRLIAEIKKLHTEGRSLRAIARTLTERNFVNRKGKSLDAKQVSRILDASKVSEAPNAEALK
jgi:DNA invertase Pin-like site-specific DNA recombinase